MRAANWLLEIGAPFDPAPSPDELKAFLAQCERQWSLLANKGERGSYYSVMLERAPSMRATIDDAAELARLAAEARSLSYPTIDELVRQAAGKGGAVNPAKIPELKQMAEELIAERANMSHVVLPEGLVEERVSALALGGSGAAGAPGAASGLFRELIAKKPAGSHKYRSIESDLSLFDVDNFIDYAYGPSSWPASTGNPSYVLSRAEEKLGDYQKGTSERSAAERLRSRAREVAGSDEEWKRYLEYLQWRDSKAALDRVGRLARLADGRVGAEVAESAIARIAAVQNDRDRARELLEGYCASQEPALVLSADEPAPVAADPRPRPAAAAPEPVAAPPTARIEPDMSGFNFVTCPHCGRRVSAGNRFCTVCGRDLQVNPSRAVPVRQVPVQVRGGRQVQAPRQQTPPPPAPRKRSAAPVVILVVVVLLLSAAVGAFFALGGPDWFFGKHEATEPGAVQVDSSSTADCSASTRIVPVARGGEYLAQYEVSIGEVPAAQGSSESPKEIMKLNVVGNGGGFAIKDFIDNGAQLSDGRYQLVITDSATKVEYRLVVNYRYANGDAPKTIELNCG